MGGDTMGTFYSIRYWNNEPVDSNALRSEVQDLLDTLEDELSNWQTDSWVNRFNAAPAGQRVPIPQNAFEVLSLCLELAEHSGGRFDPTAGQLVELWGFGTNRHTTVPSPTAIEAALQCVGHQNLDLNRKQREVTKTVDRLQLNVSAVAKGYAVDLVAELLVSSGIDNFLVNIGGEIAARGTRTDGASWKVGIPQPSLNGGSAGAAQVLSLSNRSLATSGHSQRAFMQQGLRYTHILNPRSGEPVDTGVASVTVLAPSCALADGLATLALILDETEMDALLENHYPEVEVFRTPWHEADPDD